MSKSAPLLEIQNVTKEFPGVKALDGVSLSVNRGEVMALLGENGAGKSTLMKILSGAYNRDSGNILIDGQNLPLQYKPLDGQHLGIGIIYQELSLLTHLSVAENIYLAKEPRRIKWLGMLDYKAMKKGAREQLAKLNANHIAVDAKVQTLSLPEKQMVEIAKALALDCKVIIMDEPTTTLTWEETQELFNVIQALKQQNVTIIYISHRLDEIFQVADRATILRDGRVVGDLNIGETDMNEIISLMTGQPISSFSTKDIVQHAQWLKDAIAKKPDALIVSCLDATTDRPLITNAVNQGIPVINFDTPCTDSPVQGFVGRIDCTNDGVETAEALAVAINYQGEVAILAGNPTSVNHQQRVTGFKQSMAKYPDIKIIAELFDNDDLGQAETLTSNIIQTNPDLAGIFGANASAPVGAGRAILNAEKSGRIKLVGMDDLPEMVDYIRNGTALATSVQDVAQIGYLSIRYAIDLVDGQEIPAVHDMGSRLVTANEIESYKNVELTTAVQNTIDKDGRVPARNAYHFVFVPKLAHPWYDAVREGADQAVAELAEKGVVVSYDWDAPLELSDSVVKQDAPKELLKVEELSDGKLLTNVPFTLYENEVLGIAGLVGAGRTELARLIFGADRRAAGKVMLNGKLLNIGSPAEAVQQGIGYLSENRKEEGLNLGLSLEDNVVMTDLTSVSSFGVVNKKGVRHLTKKYIDRIRIKGKAETVALTLSGGNQQKVVIAKWVHAGCKVLIFDEPTRGVDVGAKGEIHSIIRDFATGGNAAIVISSEAEELADVCDRVLIMTKGKFVHMLEGTEVTKDIILQFVTKGVATS